MSKPASTLRCAFRDLADALHRAYIPVEIERKRVSDKLHQLHVVIHDITTEQQEKENAAVMNQTSGWRDSAQDNKQIIKKYAVRVTNRPGDFLGYMRADGKDAQKALSEINTFNNVNAAVVSLLRFVREYPNISFGDKYEIVGVELEVTQPVPVVPTTRFIREIPLKTL